MIDDLFATRVFEKFDIIDRTVRDLCNRITVMETIHDENEKKIIGNRISTKDRRNWYFGIVSFVFFSYIAIKEIM